MRSLLAALAALAVGCSGSKPPSSSPAAPASAVPAAASRAAGSPLFRQNDVVAYRITDQAGRALGRSHSTYLRSEDGQPQVVTRVQLEGGEAPLQIEHATTFRNDLTPVRYKRLSSTDGRYELRFLGDGIEVATDRGIRKVQSVNIRVPVLPEDDLMMLALAIDGERVAAGASATMDVFQPATREREPWPLLAYARAEGGLKVQLPSGSALLDPSGRIVELKLPDRIYRAEVPPGKAPDVHYSPPLSYEKPHTGRWDDRAIQVPVQGGVLAGVLSVPLDRSVWPKRLAPVVVFLSGRGEQDRNGFQGSIDRGTWEVLDRLADSGYATLRIDDRGVGASSSSIEPADRGLGLLVGDAEALLLALQKQPDIDPDRSFVIGHGLGGVVALLLAARKSVAGLVLIGTPIHPLAHLRPFAELEKRGEIADADRKMRQVAAALGGDQAAAEKIGVEGLRAFRGERALIVELGKLDLGAEIAKIKAPVAVVQGLADIEVSWKDDGQPLVEMLKKAVGKERVKLLFYDRVDHFLKSEPKQSTLARYADRSRRIEPQVLDDLVKWLGAQTGATP